MVILLTIVLIIGLFLIIGCLSVRGAMIRAFEEKHGLTDLANLIKDTRSERNTMRVALQTIEAEVYQASETLEQIEKDLNRVDQQIAQLPKQVYEMIFVIGHPAPGLSAYDFIVTRSRRTIAPGTIAGIEWEIWTKPRLLQVFARNQNNALSVAQNRFVEGDGFNVRIAERIAPFEKAQA